MSDRLTALWAKLPRDERSGASYHPLLCHMVDVGMVARAVWSEVLPTGLREKVARDLGMDEASAGQWVAFWAGLHDLGKACPAFQFKEPSAQERLTATGLPRPRHPLKAPHGIVTAHTLPDILVCDFGHSRDLASRLATLLGGHHGVFPSSRVVHEVASEAIGRGVWIEVRRELALALASALHLPSVSPQTFGNVTAMVLAGFVCVSDWVGSAGEFFPLAADGSATVDPVPYAAKSEQRAGRALSELGWMHLPTPYEPRAFPALFPHIQAPNPLQQATVLLAPQLTEPGLVIIEAPTGEGKTEAALFLADHWGALLGQRGSYFALPTQATSNQMFGRVRDFLAESHHGSTVDLQLLHGHAALSAEFEVLQRSGDRLLEMGGNGGAEDGDSEEPTVVASEWFTFRKRGLLSPFGVGTIDQALLAVLKTRHVFVRLFGLSHKTVVIDEVHAYDTYMTTLLERLLEWLAALGSSVVLLSATLPDSRRRALLEAYARGACWPAAGQAAAGPYPRIAWATASGSGGCQVETSQRSRKTVQVAWVDMRPAASVGEPFELGVRLREALRDGGCAAVICNTVRQAQDVYQALAPYFPSCADDGLPELGLLHARYPFEERDRRERLTRLRFGKPEGILEDGGAGTVKVRRPRRAVLVATQIIEQSLDLDFDLMVTELAPVDLVLQRAGRLHRHERERPARLRSPALVLSDVEVDGHGVPRFDQGTTKVYDQHVLLRSWLALRSRATIRVPEDVEALIEEVYGEELCREALADPLRQIWEETLRQRQEAVHADQHEASNRWLGPPWSDEPLWRMTADALEEDAPEFHRAHQALTRLIEPTVDVVFLHSTPERPCLNPDLTEPVDLTAVPTVSEAKRLLQRSVPVGDRRVVYKLLEQDVPRTWRRSPLLRHHRLLVLDPGGGAPVGKWRLELDPEIGLVVREG